MCEREVVKFVSGLLLLLCGCQLVFPLDAVEICPLPTSPRCGVSDPDEDRDDIPDDCDPCPQLADADTDTDADGIGDACDPAVDVPASCNVRRFLSLETADGWTDPAGWTFDGDAGNQSGSLAVLRSEDVRGPGRMETVIADQLPIEADSLAGVVMFAGEGTGYLCALHPTGGGTGKLILAELLDGNELLIDEEPDDRSFSLTPGRSHRVRLTVARDGHVICRSDGKDDAAPTFGLDAEIETDVMRPLAGSFGLAIRGLVDTSFRYADFIPE